jgi:hypothetical protein
MGSLKLSGFLNPSIKFPAAFLPQTGREEEKR